MRLARCAAVLGVVALAALTPTAVAAVEPLPAKDVIVTIPEPKDGGTAGGVISNAQLRWGLNLEAGAGAFAGGCNFLSAGRAGDAGSSRVWTEADGLYSATDGNVRIEKPTASGGWAVASFADKCLDAAGNVVTLSSLTSATGNQAVIDGGTGRLIEGGGLEISWKGSFTVVFYGGMTYWSVSDPQLALDAGGNGQLTGTASGYGSSMEDASRWEPIADQRIVLTELRGAGIRDQGGFTVVPEYLGVTAADAGQIPRTAENAAHWGAFPASFVDFHRSTGQLGYWLSTGGVRDPAKSATAVHVSFDADAPIAVAPPVMPPAAGEAPVNNTQTRPASPPRSPSSALRSPSAAAAGAAEVAGIGGAPLTFMPERDGLVPAAVAAALSPAAVPLMGAALALLVSILAVLNMMGALPWQRATP